MDQVTMVKRKRKEASARKARGTRERRVPSDKPIHKIRLANLAEVVKTRFDGNASACAVALARSHTYLWQLLNRQRSIGEESARYIEERLGLVPGSLDQSNVYTPTRVLRVQVGPGKTRNYFMVPRVEFSALCKPRLIKLADQAMPCPVEGASEATVYFQVEDEMMDPLLRYQEWAFADPKQKTLRHLDLYAVCVKKENNAPVVRQARKYDQRWRFCTPQANGKGSDPPQAYEQADVTVFGRIVWISRDPSQK